jgi:hypothetical protein
MDNKLNIYCLLLMLSCFGYAFGIAENLDINIEKLKRNIPIFKKYVQIYKATYEFTIIYKINARKLLIYINVGKL